MSDHLTDEQLDAMRALGDSLVAPGSAELPDAALDVLADHDILLAEVRRLREQRAEALALATAQCAADERENHSPTVWAADIRDALEADDE